MNPLLPGNSSAGSRVKGTDTLTTKGLDSEQLIGSGKSQEVVAVCRIVPRAQAWRQAPHQRLPRRVEDQLMGHSETQEDNVPTVPGEAVFWSGCEQAQRTSRRAGDAGPQSQPNAISIAIPGMAGTPQKAFPNYLHNFSFPCTFPGGQVIRILVASHPLAFNSCLFKLRKGKKN